MSLKITGRLPSGATRERIRNSPNYKQKEFQNLSPTPMMADDASYWKMLRDFFSKNKDTVPPAPIPYVKTDLRHLPSDKPVLIWFGHSSYLIHINGKNILVDPVFSGNASPVSFMIKAFPGTSEYKVEDLPEIDCLILTHDHYDHLDFKTIRKLKNRIKLIYCSLGISSHLVYWGIDASIITEMDWWEKAEPIPGIHLIAAPARHFSGRGIKRNQTLWSSFILKTNTHSIYIGGDSGYDSHFKTIGEKYGPFDIAILEAGQYNVLWPLIHMMPEETVQAAVDLSAKTLMPVHWGKFSLAMHAWNEPIKRVTKKAGELGMQLVTPKIGEPVAIGEPGTGIEWWNFLQ